MTKFNYLARDSSGQSVTGSVVAATPAAASKQIRQDGKFLIRLQAGGPAAASEGAAASVQSARPGEAVKKARGRIRRSDIVFLTTELAVMTDTGVPLADALDALTQQASDPALRAMLSDVADRVKSGEEFSAALARHKRVFSPMYVAMVRAAEASGTLGVMLDRVATYLSDEEETRKKVRAAMTYPCVMTGFAIAVTVFLMAFVLPRFTAIYANRQAALPLPTRLVMGTSEFIVGNWAFILVAVAGLAGGAVAFFRHETGKDWWATVQLKVPLLGGMFHKAHMTRCLRTLGTLIGTGVSMLEAVQITRQVVDRGPFARLWDDVDGALRAGQQLSERLFRTALIPQPVSQMIAAGEKTGRLADVLERVSAFCDRSLKSQIKAVTAMIEPIMIMVMGAVIGAVVLALLLPIFSISKVMAGPGR